MPRNTCASPVLRTSGRVASLVHESGFRVLGLRKSTDYSDSSEEMHKEGSLNLNSSLHAVLSFLGLPYWKRVWIFQELVLAREVLLVTTGSSLNYEVVHRVGARLHSMTRLQSQNMLPEKPSWISAGTWMFFTTAVGGWEALAPVGTVFDKPWICEPYVEGSRF